MSMWNFKAGDKVFCVWPKKDIGLEGGEHLIQSVEGQYVRIEGISRYIHNWRFVKVATMPSKPEPTVHKPNILNFIIGHNYSNTPIINDCMWNYTNTVLGC